MKYRDFEVDPAFVRDDGAIGWVVTGNGEYILGSKKGRRFFIKRNIHLRFPMPSDPEPVYEAKKACCLELESRQQELRRRMSSLGWDKDGIVTEEECFWDEDNKFVTVMAHISDAVSSETNFSTLSKSRAIELCDNITERIEKLHKCGVIHGDLKMKNILFKPSGAGYTTYLIDFDSSYPTDGIPDSESIGGSAGYMSPEIIAYAAGGCEASDMTVATDIFSLGLIFHVIWSGAFPATGTSAASAGDAVLSGEKLGINKRFNERIGKNKGATLMSLINWMTTLQPTDRPTAEQVRAVLQDRLEVPCEYHIGDDEKPFDTECWDAHKLICRLLSTEALKEKGLTAFKRLNEGIGSTGLKYSVTTAAGCEIMTVDEIISAGYAEGLDAEVDEPWPEHKIEMEGSDEILAKGYARIKRSTILFRKRYLITTVGGRQFDKSWEWLVNEGLARMKRYERVEGTPWPEHGKEYVPDNMLTLGITAISRVEVGDEHRYKLVYSEMIDGAHKVNDKVSVKNVKLMGLIR